MQIKIGSSVGGLCLYVTWPSRGQAWLCCILGAWGLGALGIFARSPQRTVTAEQAADQRWESKTKAKHKKSIMRVAMLPSRVHERYVGRSLRAVWSVTQISILLVANKAPTATSSTSPSESLLPSSSPPLLLSSLSHQLLSVPSSLLPSWPFVFAVALFSLRVQLAWLVSRSGV